MNRSLSERIIEALLQLQQFAPFQTSRTEDWHVLHALSGVRAYPIPDPEEIGYKMILLKYPGGHEAEVSGILYLDLQIPESVRHEFDSTGEGYADPKRVRARIDELRTHLYRKHDL